MTIALLVLFSLTLLFNIFYTSNRDAPLSYSLAAAITVAFAFLYLSSELYVRSIFAGASIDFLFVSVLSVYPVKSTINSSPRSSLNVSNLTSTVLFLAALARSCLHYFAQCSPGPNAKLNPISRYLFLALGVILFWQLLLAILTPVSNADQLSYNTARLYSFLLVGTPFLQSTTLIHHAFHPIGHDILFIREVLLNQTVGLALLSWLELILFIILSNTLLYEYLNKSNRQSEVDHSNRHQLLCFALLNTLILSQPMVSFQALVAKNDMIIALFILSLICMALRLIQILSIGDSLLAASTCFILILLCLLQLVNSKGLGVFAIPPTVIVFMRLCLQYSHRIQQYFNRLWSMQTHVLRISSLPATTSLLSLVCLLWIYTSRVFYFLAFKTHFWEVDYSAFKISHGPSNLSGHLLSTLVNGTRALVSTLIDIPLMTQIGKNDNSLISMLDSYGLTRNGEEYYVGGYFGQDIAWPGLFFNTILCLTGLAVIVRFIRSTKDIRRLLRSILFLNTLPNLIVIYSLSYTLLIPFFIYWQPQSARYYMVPFMLISLIPPLVLGKSEHAKTIK